MRVKTEREETDTRAGERIVTRERRERRERRGPR